MVDLITIKGEEFVVISKKAYNELVERDDWLTRLEAAGVDNWSGMDYVISMQGDENDCE